MDLLIVEDHPVVINGLQKLFKESNICAECPVVYTGKECMEVLKNYKPQIILLDINLPDISGIDLCSKIVCLYSDVKIIALSSYASRSMINKMIDNGARGYLLKNSDGEEIIMALNKVLNGVIYLSGTVKNILEKKAPEGVPVLTRREIEVLKLIADGMTNNEIAEAIFISPLTVDSHRKNLLTKLGARNTAALVKIAMTHNLIQE